MKFPPGTTIIIIMLVAHMVMMLGFSSFPALLPLFYKQWGLSGTEAGLINAALFTGYTLSVPFLVAITDRIDPRRVYLFGAATIVVAHSGFAAFAYNGITASFFNAMFGIGLAATYMPGLRILGEYIPSEKIARATGFYTIGFSLGAAISYFTTAKLAQIYDWRSVYWFTAAGGVVGLVLIAISTHPHQPEGKHQPWRKILDPRPAFANSQAMAFSISYGLHTLELMTYRSWVVAFLTAAALHNGNSEFYLQPAAIAAIVTLGGIVASLFGNELAIRYGRRRTISKIMLLGGVSSIIAAWSFNWNYQICVILVMIHGFIIMLDSSALTAGAFERAKPSQRGITMAVHSTLGFGGGALGPFLFGSLLDIAGHNQTGWFIAYAHVALFVFLGPLVFRWLWPKTV